jgi:hypothetical protein
MSRHLSSGAPSPTIEMRCYLSDFSGHLTEGGQAL